MYLESVLTHGDHGQKISCPSRCNQILEEEQILKLLRDSPQITKLYRQSLVNTYVETNRLTHWCPGTPCTAIVKLKSSGIDCAQMINCDICKMVFCFQCLKQWHDPIQCSLLQKWEKKNRDESMTSEWIIASVFQFFCLSTKKQTFLFFFSRYKRMSKLSCKYRKKRWL